MSPFVMHLGPVAASAASYVEVAQGLNARLAFSQERDASFWYDEGTFDNDGALVNAPAWNAEGGPGAGLPGYFSFNGTDQRIDLGDSTPLRFAGTDRAFVWWMRFDGAFQPDWVQAWGKGNFDYGCRQEGSNATSYEIAGANSSFGGNAYVTLPANEWVMLVAQAAGSAYTVHRVTGEGVTLLGSDTITAALVESTSKFKFAAQDRTATADTTRRFWRGDLAGFLAFTSALTTAEMEELYAAAMDDTPAPPPASAEAQVFEPYYEWSFMTTDYSGDPYDVHALATFTRQGSADTYDVALFYAGGNTFKLRFTGPRTGTWDFTTASAHAGLNGLTGSILITANSDPNAKGFLSTDGTLAYDQAFAYQTGDGTTTKRKLTNSYMRHSSATSPAGFETWGDLPTNAATRAQVISDNLDLAQANGFDTLFTLGYHNWVEWPLEFAQNPSTSEYPDPGSFDVLEELLQALYDRGMFLHIWWGGNDQAQASMRELVGGIGGTTDMRVRRYIAARLGAFPNWYMEPGYDLGEWLTPAQAQTWIDDMRALNTLPRLYAAREARDGQANGFYWPTDDKKDYFSQDFRPTSDFYTDAATQLSKPDPSVPTVYGRRFLHTRDNVWDMTTTRRAIWQFTMAGYAGGIYGTIWSAGADYPNPEWLKTIGDFWEDRVAVLMGVKNFIDGVAVDGRVVATHNTYDRQVVYKENTNSIAVTIPTGMTNVPVVAVDTIGAYAEVSMGTYDAGTHTISLASTSDWVLAVGDFF